MTEGVRNRIEVMHGVNLDQLGRRDPLHYGTLTFGELERRIAHEAAGLGLTPREAALRQRDPNGGVRNLIVAPGSWDERVAPDQLRVIEVRRLRGLEIDPFTGDADLELALAVDRATGAPFAGGTLRLDLIDVLAKAKRSARTIRRGPYVGPAAVLIDRAERPSEN